MFGGGSDQMEQMMKQMGIDFEKIKAEKVTIETEDGDEMVFTSATVNQLQGQGQEVYQIMGSPDSVNTADPSVDQDVNDKEEESEEDSGTEITEDDVDIVALRAGVSDDVAREALEETDGDLAKAIQNLED